MDEAQVPITKRYEILKILGGLENKHWKDVRLALEKILNDNHIQKISDLTKLKGTISQLEDQLKKLKFLRRPDRFTQVLNHMKSLRNYLKYLSVLEIDSGPIYFDFGLFLEDQTRYYSGIFFKVLISGAANQVEETIKAVGFGISSSEQVGKKIRPSGLGITSSVATFGNQGGIESAASKQVAAAKKYPKRGRLVSTDSTDQ